MTYTYRTSTRVYPFDELDDSAQDEAAGLPTAKKKTRHKAKLPSGSLRGFAVSH